MGKRLTDLAVAYANALRAGDDSGAAALADMLHIEQENVRKEKTEHPQRAEWEEK